MRKIIALLITMIMAFSMCACGGAGSGNSGSDIDYMALVNKLNPLPENWEENLETIHMTNSRKQLFRSNATSLHGKDASSTASAMQVMRIPMRRISNGSTS